MEVTKAKWFSVTGLKVNISLMHGKVPNKTSFYSGRSIINYFQGVRERKIKRFFSMVRKQHYVCEAFIRRQIKNSTSGVNAKINWFKKK